jgi:small subunit ribosomal protein S16
MVVRIRMSRLGRHDLPFYRMVVADGRAPRDGKFLEHVGSYNPIAQSNSNGTKEVSINVERIKYWISQGAQPSETVARLLAYANILPAPPLRMSAKPEAPAKAE